MTGVKFDAQDEADLADANERIFASLELAKHNASFAAQLAAAFMASGVIGGFAIVVIGNAEYTFSAAAFIAICLAITAILYFVSRDVLKRRLPK